MSNQTDLLNALLSSAESAIGGAYPTAWPNRPFPNKPTDETWLRVTPLYSAPIEVGLNELDRIDGVLQIDIFVPADSGSDLAMAISDMLRNSLPTNGESYTSGGISVQYSRAGINGVGNQDGAWTKYMFTANFLTFVDRTA